MLRNLRKDMAQSIKPTPGANKSTIRSYLEKLVARDVKDWSERKFITLVAADDVYFNKFGPALIESMQATASFPLHCTVIDPKEQTISLLNDIRHFFGIHNFFWAIAYTPKHIKTDVQKRVFYASRRYTSALQLLKQSAKNNWPMQVHSIDIDSLFNRPLPAIDCKLGLYLRDDQNLGANEIERRGMKVLGHTILSTDCIPYLKRIVAYIAEHNYAYWFLDQEALWYSLTNYERQFLYDISSMQLLDWEYHPDSFVWSGKGNRKYQDFKYLELFNAYKAKSAGWHKNFSLKAEARCDIQKGAGP